MMGGVDEPFVTLCSAGLLSKWGFNDGDAPDDYLDYCEERGVWRSRWRELLPRVVREYVLPALGQKVETVEIGTNHNPVRARTVDGVNVEDHWYDHDDPVMLTPETVCVPMAAIFAMEQETA
jgi:hypothetical protein